ncbi:Phage T7 exclusion protein, partial [hydrothermal vent metagenome]
TNAATQHGINFYFTILLVVVIFLLAVLSIYVGQDLNLDELNTFESLLGTGWVGVLLLGLVKTAQKTWRFLEHPLADKLNTYLRLPDYGKHLGEIPIIKREIESLCEARLGAIPNGRLLVVVDDLDRCHPEKITETLDAIRLVMNLKNVAVVVAIDDRIAFRSVAEHYKDLAQDGMRSKEEVARDYLGKIIQLPVNLYRPWPSEIKNFIGKHLFQVAEETDAPKIDVPPDGPTEVSGKPVVPRVSPTAAALIKEQNLNAMAITGNGKKGRILKRDVVDFLQVEVEKKPENTSVTEVEETGRVEGSTAVPGPETDPDMEMDEAKRQEREAVMQDTASERDLFAELTRDMGFHNPRQLIRLRNSYRLLKGYRHSREGGSVDVQWVERLLHGLFWYEFLYQQKLTDRRLAELVAWQWSGRDWEKDAVQKSAEAREKTAASNDGRPANPPVVNMSRRLNRLFAGDAWDDGYADLMRTVQMVVLPNAQMGLLLSRHDMDGALDELTAATEGVPLDPWNLSLVARFKQEEPFSMHVDD